MFFDFNFSDFSRARALADQMNSARDLERHPELTVRAGRLAAAGLLDEIIAHVIAVYVQEVEPTALTAAPGFLDENLGATTVDELMAALLKQFAPPPTRSGRPVTLEYMLRLWLVNENPALANIRELFNDEVLRGNPPEPDRPYNQAFFALDQYFETLPHFGPEDLSLLKTLLLPIRRFPNSVEDQLRLIMAEWGDLVAPYQTRLLLHLDLIREEEKPIFFGPGPTLVPDYKVGMNEFEAFTPDREWMPRSVLLAKNTYVWLDQLSKEYGRHIYRLDQVPDEELDLIAKRGFTGLWLIGVWQRSKASQRIKQITGNPDAIASAYSLHAYDIAWELGGVEAMDDLRARAGQRGIRMASDMVPNHMAIDSKWVVEHPDWFISLPFPPFPKADFNTPNLCDDGRVEVFLEEGYYSKSDASVVFKRRDAHTGDDLYVYHGNDGTHMPWNDTAQLNYLIPEVREAVIQTILHVARQFPIIRFDAAMTLAKRHYHRLWFPAPGEGGDIPSRAGRGLTAEEFDAVMPQEFWREVVDRIAAEAPDTLLLAEAFWLMESYFVRTLGMHRVYNSAFMNMMRKEENAKYRQVLKNTLEFDPDILGRFVNFMNNPDEKTAVEQFGKGDKYFGICTLMATLPGLPMFGHGQVEGYGEKYGMEYPRAYWNEQPDAGLIGHHERVIFPLLHKRHLFAGSENFVLYDFWTGSGEVNENVFAFSNRSRGERALVLYNNHDAPASGWIKSSVGMVHKQPDGSKPLRQLDLGFALDLRHGPQDWVVFRDTTSGLEFLRKSEELHGRGLYFELGPYGYRSFLDWREVKDEHGQYARLAGYIGLGGVPNVEIAVKEMLFEPFHGPFRALADPELWRAILGIAPEPVLEEIPAAEVAPAEAPVPAAAPAYADPIAELETRYVAFLTSVRGFLHLEAAIDPILAATMRRVEAVAALPPCVPADVAKPADVPSAAIVPLALTDEARLTLLAWATVAEIGRLGGESGAPARSRAWVDDWLLDARLADCLAAAGVGPPAVTEGVAAVKILTAHAGSPATGPFPLLSALLADKQVQAILGVNRWDGVIWFRREGFEKLIQWLRQSESLTGHILPLDPLVDAARASGYRLVRLMEAARPAGVPAKSGNGAAQVAGPATAIAAPVSTLKPGV